MPLIQVTLIEGRSMDAKAKLICHLTEATTAAIGAPRESVRVIIQEVPAAHWGVGGVPKSISESKEPARESKA
ncbi:4-oxalocrotonate tautomerase [Trinickia dinghuensis]|uniref:Tautomerase n=1 Tax=Trinickia dinghuensis TaxID=2291023 RepID=A0A3D8K210_9BURK|nr:4-oxalocrotonate tautomerase [Trinickia dinghuensis]RDU98875.1 4-oxalocrotonate tautomerase [Trinickia dinghuensis]